MNLIKTAGLAAVVVLGLAGCGNSPAASVSPSNSAAPSATASGSTSGSAADLAVLDSIAWGADSAGVPTLAFTAPLAVTAAAARLIKEGAGAGIKAGDLATFDYVVTSGNDASVLYSTYTSGATAETIFLSSTSVDPVFYSAFVGHKVGATLIFANLSTDSAGATVPVFVAITIKSVMTPLTRAQGDAVAPVAGNPVVTLGADGEPSVAIPATTPPTALVSQTLIQGTGEPIAEGQTVLANYAGWLWDGTSFDKSWGTGAPATMSFVTGSLIDGWIQGLAGAKVGSQVLLVVPPSLGYGDTTNGSIPGGSTLVFVVDILAAF